MPPISKRNSLTAPTSGGIRFALADAVPLVLVEPAAVELAEPVPLFVPVAPVPVVLPLLMPGCACRLSSMQLLEVTPALLDIPTALAPEPVVPELVLLVEPEVLELLPVEPEVPVLDPLAPLELPLADCVIAMAQSLKFSCRGTINVSTPLLSSNLALWPMAD